MKTSHPLASLCVLVSVSLSLTLGVAGCVEELSLAEEDTAAYDGDSLSASKLELAPSLSYVGQAVLRQLESHSDQRGSTWNTRFDTGFDTDWVVQTPLTDHWGQPESALANPECRSNCDRDFGLQQCDSQIDCIDGGTCTTVQATSSSAGEQPRKLCVGHSDAIYDTIYLGLIQAERFVDITTLSRQDDRFEAAVRNALTYLSEKGAPIRVRILYGNIIGLGADTDQAMDSLTRDLDRNSPMEIYVGAYRKGLDSWNHAKIIAVDGEWMLSGGHNMWTRDYLKQSPVHDLSMATRGTVAEDGHRFADAMWSYACTDPWFWSGATARTSYPSSAGDCPPSYEGGEQKRAQQGASTFALGRLGAIGENPADDAIMAALRSARASIKLSLQDIGPVSVGGATISGWPQPVLRELALAVVRGVDVFVVLSNLDAAPDGKRGLSAGYANGWTAADVVTRVGDWLARHPQHVPPDISIQTLLCDRLHVGNLRFNDVQERYNDGTGIGNHAKFFIVDDVAFYLGSQNLYPSNLSEFGLLVDDAAVTSDILTHYWDLLWRYSERTITAGRTAGGCSL